MMQRPELLDTTGCPLATDWSLAMTAAGDVASPDALGSGLDWLRATVPGTVAAALAAAGPFGGFFDR